MVQTECANSKPRRDTHIHACLSLNPIKRDMGCAAQGALQLLRGIFYTSFEVKQPGEYYLLMSSMMYASMPETATILETHQGSHSPSLGYNPTVQLLTQVVPSLQIRASKCSCITTNPYRCSAAVMITKQQQKFYCWCTTDERKANGLQMWLK